jgi:hypothetical protein
MEQSMRLRDRLEDIWNHKPYGYFKKSFLPNYKSGKDYVYEVFTVETIKHNPYEITVFSKDEVTAKQIAIDFYKNKYGEETWKNRYVNARLKSVKIT